MPSTHKQEKPWDTDDIDKWRVRPNFIILLQSNTDILCWLMHLHPTTMPPVPSPKNPPSQLSSPNTAKSTSRKHGR